MNAREKDLKQKTLYGKLIDQDLNLTPMTTVKQLDERTGESSEPLQCPLCFKAVMTGWPEHTYVQYQHYTCIHCGAELVFVAFSDHPEQADLRFANLVMIN
jgi:predicted SprT family Zn-dependent metalloprotease